jgi:hypothetical protein
MPLGTIPGARGLADAVPGRVPDAHPLTGLAWVPDGRGVRHEEPGPQRRGDVPPIEQRAPEGARPRRRARGRILCAAAVLGGVVAVVLAILALAEGGRPRNGPPSPQIGSVSGSARGGRHAEPQAGTLTEAIDLRRLGPPVPRGFLGLSFEASSLPEVARLADSRDFVAMLRSLGEGVLRFGGASADTRVAWTDAATPLPPWASVALDPADLRALRKLLSRVRWHVVLTVGLAHYDPSAAAREVSAAKGALGPWLAGIEIGNEPDAYARHGLRSRPWTVSRYEAEVGAYRKAIARHSPGIPLMGPDLSGSKALERWGPGAAAEEKLALLTGHHYPLGCHERPPPSIARLLDPEVRRLEQRALRAYVSVSRASGIPVRLDEANTVSCGGRNGVSNTFASALWAVDFIARAMAAGIAGINLQANPANCRGYSPVCAPSTRQLAAGALVAQPEWYALRLTKALVGDRPVRADAKQRRPNVDVIPLLTPRGRLAVVIVDDEPPGAARLAVDLRVGLRFGAATILQLAAPSPSATQGVRLGCRPMAPAGSWRADEGRDPYGDRGGVVALPALPDSAMLVTIAPRRGRA